MNSDTQHADSSAAISDTPSLADLHAVLTGPGAPFEMEIAVIRGVPTRVWKNAPGTLNEIFQASLIFDDRDFLVFEAERATYALSSTLGS